MSKNYFESRVVYLSGPPCTGKSSVLDRLGGVGFTVIPEFYEKVPTFVREAFSQGNREKVLAQDWAIEQHQVKAKKIAQSVSVGENVAIDRSPLDVAAYSHYLGLSVYSETLTRLNMNDWVPGENYYLFATSNEITSRFLNRDGVGALKESDWKIFFNGLNVSYLYQLRLLRELSPGLSVVSFDTMQFSIGEIVNSICSVLPEDKHLFDFNYLFKKLSSAHE